MTSNNVNLSRREALASIGLLALSCKTGLAAEPAAPTAGSLRRGIALQMYTMREPAKKDLAGTLQKVRAMRWEYVQWSGMPNLPAEQIRQLLDAAGLKAIAAHLSVEAFEKDFDGSVRFWKTVGAKDVAPGGMMKDCKATLADWLKGAQRLDAVGAKLRAVGMRLSYHNHSFEFEQFPGDPRRKIDILLDATRPENLKAELDTAWAFHAGADPAAFLRQYKGRCPVIHAKDILAAKGDKKKAQLKPLGQGDLDWKGIFAAARQAGVEWYVYEQDSGEGSPFDYARASYEFLAKNVL